MRKAAVSLLLVLLALPGFCSGDSERSFYGLTGVNSVSVDAGAFAVEVRATYSDRLDLDVEPAENASMVRTRETGNRLDVWIEGDWPLGLGASGTIRLSVPRNARVNVHTTSGRILLDGMNRGAQAKTISGSITAEGGAGVVQAETVSGAILVRDLQGSMAAKTVSGAIRGDGLRLTADSTLSSVSGVVELELATPLDDLRFDLTTVSGRLTVGNVGAYRGLRMGMSGPVVRANTVSGSISFR